MAARTFRMSTQPGNVLYVCLKNHPDFVLLIVNYKVKANAVPLANHSTLRQSNKPPLALGPVARSLVSANRWLRGIKMYRFSWYLTLVSTNHAWSNPGLDGRLHRLSLLYLSSYPTNSTSGQRSLLEPNSNSGEAWSRCSQLRCVWVLTMLLPNM